MVIIKILGKTYLNTPTTTDEWLKILQNFKKRWNFPNGIDAVDGKHIILKQPKNSGSHYRNYKGTDSIILFAIVSPEYEFLFADVGMNGRNSDGGNWSQVFLKNGFETNTLNLPNPIPLPSCKNPIPYVCTGNRAFPLISYVVNPYPQKHLTLEKRIFTYRLSRMRRISENAFGITASGWRVFRRAFHLEPEKVMSVTPAVITFHNWLRRNSKIGKLYVPQSLIDRQGPGELL